MKQYNYIYLITNKLNGKIYIGKHSTDDLDDGKISDEVCKMHSIYMKNYYKTNPTWHKGKTNVYSEAGLKVNIGHIMKKLKLIIDTQKKNINGLLKMEKLLLCLRTMLNDTIQIGYYQIKMNNDIKLIPKNAGLFLDTSDLNLGNAITLNIEEEIKEEPSIIVIKKVEKHNSFELF